MSDGGDADGGGTPFANSPTYDPSSPVDSPGHGGGGDNDEAAQQPAPAAATEGEADVNTIWEAIQDDEGRTYYYNTVTGETQWDQPDDFPGEAPAE